MIMPGKMSAFLSLSLAVVLLVGAAPAMAAGGLEAGVAKVDITPKDLTGLVGIVPKPYGGVHDRLYARALVLESGADTAAIVSLDLVEMGNTTALRARIAKDLGIPADHIIIAASHDHNAPRAGPITPGTSSATGRPYSPPAYIQQVDDAIVEALRDAKQGLQPARFGYGTGKVDVSLARYGYTPERGWRENPNEDGFSDKTLAVVKFETASGQPLAVLFNYAVHSNSMTGEAANLISGDIAGNAEAFVENQFDGKVVALWSMGAAADQYPKFNWDMGLLTKTSSVYAPAEMQGSMIGGEVTKVLKQIRQTTDKVSLYAAERDVACPMNVKASGPDGPGGSAAPAGGQQGPGPATAKPLLPAPKPGDELNIQLSLVRLNQLAITGASGEVGSEIFQHLKRESPFSNTIMITLSNDRDGYIPDDAGWDHQGPGGQAFVRGCAEKAIVGTLTDMMNTTAQ